MSERKIKNGCNNQWQKSIVTTFMCCASPVGFFVPPVVIYKRKTMHPALGKNMSSGSLIAISETLNINTELFTLVDAEHYQFHKDESR